MIAADLATEIHDLADQLYGADPHLDELVDNVLAILHTNHTPEQLSSILTRLAGHVSVLRLLALVATSKADSETVRSLDPTARYGAETALYSLAADLHALATGLNQIATRADASEAAWHLDPA